MQRITRVRVRKGFALPTVLIASVVLLTVLAVSITATSAVRTALKDQYYAQLAQIAGEAGVAYAKACLAANGNVPLWTDAKPLKPSTDCAGNETFTSSAKVLVVAGGGSGGGSTSGAGGGGGGGAGGLVSDEAYSLSLGTTTVTVGAGGAGVSNTRGLSGSNSIFGSITAIGGGGGGGAVGTRSGLTGGSGGGGGYNQYSYQDGALGTTGQGNKGGQVLSNNNGGGGGGAGGVGGDTNSTGGAAGGNGGLGGAGIVSTLSGATITYAKGGEGGTPPSGAAAGVANTGSGGSGTYGSTAVSGAGGSGVVVISYPENSGISASGGNESVVDGRKIHQFTSGGNFIVSSLGTACPNDARCFVTVNGNIRSGFSVPRPTVDADGKAVTIANSGYVEVTRTSTGAVWRTYTQPSVQAAVVPELCSISTSSGLGWTNAVRASTQDSYSLVPSAQSITHSNADLNAGYLYFRKDFNVTDSGTYSVGLLSAASQDQAELYIDGALVTSSTGSLSSTTINLTPGCHTALVRVTNATFLPRAVRFTGSIQRQGATTPVLVTDSSWRVSVGSVVHFSSVDYFASPSDWVAARYWTGLNWADNLAARGITSNHGATPTGYTYFRDNRTINVTTATDVRAKIACTYSCTLYLDGQPIGSGSSALVSEISLTLQPGSHRFGVRQQNSGGIGYFYMSVFRNSDNEILTQSDLSWSVSTALTTTANEYYSYEQSYVPSSSSLASGTVKVLVVGGGGGGGSDMGGGGGGGGVLYDGAYNVEAPMKVTVGAGGAGALAGVNQLFGSNGNSSSFGSLVALGGGGGGSEYGNNNSPPGSGGSGGGSAGCNQNLRSFGTPGQGYRGGLTTGCYYPTGGGGAGGLGLVNPGHGGPGIQNDILGTPYYWGGGGGGSGYTGIGGNGGIGGGGGGAVGVTTGGAGLNNGSPGGGGTTVAQTNTPGGNGGANTGGGGGGGSHYNSNNYGGRGGSGIIVISYPTGSLKATGGTILTAGSNTIHAFLDSGVFTILPKTQVVEALVVGGGGSGGGGWQGGGGGAGGVAYGSSVPVSLGSHAVTVGAGGAGGSTTVFNNGANSSFLGLTAIGGGRGAGEPSGQQSAPGDGGSGGGGSHGDGRTLANPAMPGGLGILTQGNAGGRGFTGNPFSGGGGGGAGATGQNASNTKGGNGGVGIVNPITGSTVGQLSSGSYYIGGGGGGSLRGGAAGAMGTGGLGGGAAASTTGVSATPNTGGGGGAGHNGSGASGVSGSGGSGVVVISYPTGSLVATGGTITTSGARTIHTFTTSGIFLVTSIP